MTVKGSSVLYECFLHSTHQHCSHFSADSCVKMKNLPSFQTDFKGVQSYHPDGFLCVHLCKFNSFVMFCYLVTSEYMCIHFLLSNASLPSSHSSHIDTVTHTLHTFSSLLMAAAGSSHCSCHLHTSLLLCTHLSSLFGLGEKARGGEHHSSRPLPITSL